MEPDNEYTHRPTQQVIAEHCAAVLLCGTPEEKLRVRKYMDKVKRYKRRQAIEAKRRKNVQLP